MWSFEVNSLVGEFCFLILCGKRFESRAHHHVFADFGRIVDRARVHHAVVRKLYSTYYLLINNDFSRPHTANGSPKVSMLSRSLNVLVCPIRLKHRFVRSVSNGSFSIPIVDFSGFREETSLQGRQKVGTEIVSAFKDSGFVYLSGHGIPSGLHQCFS
jgi:hypothetical protein